MDPRYKQTQFSNEIVKKNTEDIIKTEMGEMLLPSTDQELNDNDQPKESDDGAAKKKKKTYDLWAQFDEELDKEKKAPTKKNAVDVEYETYIHLDRLQRKENPLIWWMKHEAHLPRLARLAKKYLAVPSSSVPSERVFSKAGELVSARRANLNNKNVDMILFLNKN